MAVSLYLKTPKAEKSHIYVRAFVRGEKYRRTTDISIAPRFWNDEKQCVRDVREAPASKAFNIRLRAIREAAERVCDEVLAMPTAPAPEEFWRRYYQLLDGVASRKSMTFAEYMEEYAERRKKNSLRNTAKQYLTAYHWLLAYERENHTQVTFADVNLKFYEKFKQWFLSKGYTLNSLGTTMKAYKVAYRDARDVDGLHNLHETSKRGFSSATFASRTVYLSLEELQRIANVEFTPEKLVEIFPELKTGGTSEKANIRRKAASLSLIRDKFLLGAYTALRVSDFNRLRDVHIDGDYFRITTQKTGAAVVIPIHPVIRQMIDRGFDISTPITDQKINKHIKEVARLAGITQLVEGTKLIDHRAVVGFFPKCDLITTHTARRSAATNMYKAGIPSISIMRITGHTTEKAFMKYIKISAEENAELMARSAFFMG